FAAGDWAEARVAFAGGGSATEVPEALDGLGLASWFLGDVEQGIGLRQQAFAAYSVAGDHDPAARIGGWSSRQYLVSGRGSLANGWLERADRVLDERQDCAGRGWVILERARRDTRVEDAAADARRAMEIGRESGDTDLEVFALSQIGRSEISGGAFDLGMRK